MVGPVEKARLRIMDEVDHDAELQAQLQAAGKSLAVFMRGRVLNGRLPKDLGETDSRSFY